MRKIIVPTDFSDNAYNALQYACHLFKYDKCRIYLLHAYADEVYEETKKEGRSILEGIKLAKAGETERKLGEVARSIREYSPNPRHHFETVAAFGTITDAINEQVNDEDMDIVVMGTRGAANRRGTSFGSNTLQVLKYVQCPVLAIPSGHAFKIPKKILFPTNYLIPYKRRELKLLCELADSFGAAITMLYIDPMEHLSLRQEDNLQFLKECLYKPKLNFETGPQDEKATVILGHINKQDIDMLVMVNSRHTHMDDLLYLSTIDKLGLELKIPFLVLQNLPR